MLKFLCRSLLVILICVVAGTLLMGAVFSIPTKYIEPRVANAAEIIAEEGIYPVITKFATSPIDNWTDSIMLMEAAFPNGENPFVNAMMAYRYNIGEGIPNEVLVEYYESGGKYEYISSYQNYWHGYHVVLKPMLVFFEYAQIRTINGIIQTLASIGLCLILWKRGLKEYILPYLICVAILMPVALARCMQYSSCFYIMIFGSMAMLCFGKTDIRRLYVFLGIGIATSFFDFLTYPIVTFGIPAVFCLNTMQAEKPAAFLKKLLIALLVWFLGYAGMWLGKFAIGSLITGGNMFAESMGHVRQWAGEAQFSIPYVFYHNLRDFAYTPAMIAALLFAAVVFVKSLRDGKWRGEGKTQLAREIFAYGLLAILPFVYYVIMLNPSGVHFGLFSHKSLIVTAFAGLSMLVKIMRR